MAFSLAPLPYSFDALEPNIDAKTLEIHYTKHHQTYCDKLNAALEAQPEWKERSIEAILCNLGQLPEDIRTAVRNNGGGFYNHTLFWENMSPTGEKTPSGELADAINAAFGDFASFQKQFADAAVGRFGSGWVWLIAQQDKTLKIVSTPNQDNPIIEDMTVMPLLGLDVWEHAYYLNYQNRRPDYVTAWWNVVNWDVVANRYRLVTEK